MDGVPRHLIAQIHVPAVGRNTAYQIAGIQVLEADGNLTVGEILLNAIAQEQANVLVNRVAGRILPLRG